MADQDVEIKYLAKDEAVLKAFENVDRSLRGLADRFGDVERASKKSAHAVEEGFGKAGEELRGIATHIGFNCGLIRVSITNLYHKPLINFISLMRCLFIQKINYRYELL